MSSILKALKKLEEEKTVHRPGFVAIDTDILRTVTTKPRFSPAAMVLLAIVIFVSGSVATYFFMMRIVPPQHISRTLPAEGKQVLLLPAAVTTRTSSPPSTLNTEILPPVVVVVPSQPPPTKAQKVNQRLPPPQHQPVTTLAPPPADSAALPHLRVNGIAFQKGGDDTMAIINGVPVSNGTIIEGATVEEILKDRVRFSFHGDKIEIPLGQSNR
jgi:general secretion pathway protein B